MMEFLPLGIICQFTELDAFLSNPLGDELGKFYCTFKRECAGCFSRLMDKVHISQELKRQIKTNFFFV